MGNDLIKISVSDDYEVDYSPSNGMYRVSLFEKGHYVDEIWFDAYEDKEIKDNETPALRKRLISSAVFLALLMYVSMGNMMWGWPMPGFFENNQIKKTHLKRNRDKV